MAAAVFPDTTVLCNFAAVRRLDLLEDWLRGRGRWVDAIAWEVTNSARYFPDLNDTVQRRWLGEPIEITDERAVAHVERLRRDVFGGTSSQSLQHLGELQTCYLLLDVEPWRGSWWVSDDQETVRFGKRQGFVVLETIDVMRHLVAEGDLRAEGAMALMESMQDAGRAVRLPRRAEDLRS